GTNYEVNNDKTNSSNSHRASDMTSSAILIPERIDAKLFNTRSPQLSTVEHSRYMSLQSSNKPVMCLFDLTIIRHWFIVIEVYLARCFIEARERTVCSKCYGYVT